jgi:hypothetical protein
MTDNDTMVIRELKDSYCRQLDCYRALGETVNKILSRLVLTRGDFSSVKVEFAEKQRLLGCIESERAGATGRVREWQERKSAMAGRDEAKELDGVLRQIETAIRKFLEGEEQLKRYLEGIMKKGV